MALFISDTLRQHLIRGQAILTTALASRSVHKLSVDEMKLILFYKIQEYQDTRRRLPRSKVFTNFGRYLEDGLRNVELAIREITMIATKELRYHPDPSSIVAVEKRLHPAFTLNLPTPKPSPDSDADEDDTFASLRPDLRGADTSIKPSATIPPRKLELLRDMSRRFLRNIYCHLTDLAEPDIMGQSRRATGKDSGAGHARNRKKGQKEREREMVNSFKKVHIRDKK
ncbi:hypothetical protein I302_102444 [Kwoniella bestiolae CBS 10118]|uniref:Uncharacterized protein n=1 Tax=Kwoniella bestiolae CBS 10118 TaxID=1296100 RepID=A0A1B9GF49_9TREE|nr:hypothetical protein I302_01135 [Kwoniella bestiolae CBS 10118]OCF29626.1 hypothetical protein I302_01135 [Kwoniella bestiolae CBS 10118]